MVSVIGGGSVSPDVGRLAHEVGRMLAERGAVVVCGGLRGVMEAACRGAKEAGGTTVGILPGSDRSSANPWVDIVIPTGMGLTRNNLVVLSGQAVIAVDGSYGTLNEMTIALNHGIPVVALDSWDLTKAGVDASRFHVANSPVDAVDLALKLAGARP